MTIPVELRRKLELHAGDRLNCFIEDDKIIIIPVKGSLKKLKGIVPKSGCKVSLDDMNRAVVEEAAKRMLKSS
jgi:AbrB family looped-hinge helix DNA binding protein